MIFVQRKSAAPLEDHPRQKGTAHKENPGPPPLPGKKLEASTNPVREKRDKPHLETHVDDEHQTILPHSPGYILSMPCYVLLCDALLYHDLLSYD